MRIRVGMGLFGQIGRWFKRSHGATDDFWYSPFAPQVKSGVAVNTDTALRHTPVWSCIQVISETVAMLPFFYYRRLPRGKEKARDEKLYRIVHLAPNPEMTSMNFRAAQMLHLLTDGNSYSFIERNIDGEVMGLWLLNPRSMTVKRGEDKKLTYTYRFINGTEEIYPREKILHIAGMGYDGLIGYSPIDMEREAIGLSIATEESGARFFANGMRPSMVINVPDGAFKDEQARDRFKVSVKEQVGTNQTAHSLLVLEQGATLSEWSMKLTDAQWLESRGYQLAEIARIYRVPLFLLMEGSKDSNWGTGLEQKMIAFTNLTLTPYLTRIEQGYTTQLLNQAEQEEFLFEHELTALLRGDSTARSEFYQKMFNIGVFSPNQIREKENENPYDDGDEHYVPMNFIPVSQSLLPPPESGGNRLLLRTRLTDRWSPIFEKAAGEVISREAIAIKREAKKRFGKGDKEGFLRWLDEFYDEMPTYILSAMGPVVISYTASVADMLEVGGEKSNVNKFADDCLQTFAGSHIDSSKEQIKTLVEKNDPAEEINRQVDEWSLNRPHEIALRETDQLLKAVSMLLPV